MHVEQAQPINHIIWDFIFAPHLLQGRAVVGQHARARPTGTGEAGGAVGTGGGRGVAGELVRGGALLALGVLTAAVGEPRAEP